MEAAHRNKRKKLVALGVGAVLVVTALAVAASAPAGTPSPYRKLKLFARVLAEAERLYVEPVDSEGLIVGAIRGMVRTLDPHSAFLAPDEFALLTADTQGRFGGVGLEVGLQGGALTVITPLPGSPAERAGILPGDTIEAIDGKPTSTMAIDEAIRLMRGPQGSKVSATFRRRGEDKPFDVSFTREVIRVESVAAEQLGPGFAWVQVRSFQDGTTAEVARALDRLKREGGGLSGIVLDLRRNPGGVLREAVSLADLFVANGVIVTTRGRGDRVLEEHKAHGPGTIVDVPLAVLVDGASASAAEIVAGALQDHGRALLVGTRTFGKGSVQSIIDLEDGFGLKLTVARYFTPSGRSIQVDGVHPDIVVESRLPPSPDEMTAAIAASPLEGDLPGHLAPSNAVPEGSSAGPAEPAVFSAEIGDLQLRVAFQLVAGLARSRQAAASGAR